MIGHDLRNPLSALVTGTEAMMMSEGTTDTHQRILVRMKSSTGRMSRMIEQVMDFTRSRFGGIDIVRQVCNAQELVEQCISEFELAAPECELVTQLAGSASAQWDPDRISQVIANLLSNARAHGAKASPIRLSLALDAGRALIEVSNRGEPIAEKALATIFDPFKRGALAGTRSNGLGLGLYIARQIVEAHDGEITVNSTPEETRFRVTLPLG